jgi:3-oxoacyl-[acyl-carrier-protein] synthase II
MRRVFVTGLGAVSPFGAGVKAYWAGLAAGACAIRPLTLIDADGFRCRIAAEVPEVGVGSPRRSRADRLALGAASEALQDAGLAAADRLGGPRHTVVTACSSGAVALAEAAELIADGVVEVALAGGVDAVTRMCFMGFNALKLLDPEPCRPFDRDRRGMSIGEGAAFLLLESAEHARARGVRPYAELAGHGTTTDAYHITAPQPEGEGMARAMRAALAAAGLAPSAVGYANAHGTATPQNDRIEARAITEVFGAGRLLVSSTKSMIGHTMAAAGGLEAVATILTLSHDTVPPTANLVTPDPEVEFDCVPRVAREAALEHAISNSFGFGGQNITLLFRRT